MKQKINSKLTLIGILLLGGFFRFYNLNWDQWQHLHPDERFLTMVGVAMKMPLSLAYYFNQQLSTFNPANIGYEFFVYGTFPIVINKLLAVFLSYDTYNLFTLHGRFLSGVADLLLVVLVFKTIQLFEKRYALNKDIKYWGAFFYAIAVLPIQLSHFFTVDTFLNLFCFASFYTILKYSYEGKFYNFILSAIFFGLALASKVSAIFILPLVIFFLLDFVWKKHSHRFSMIQIGNSLLLIILFGFVSYIAVRIGDPYLFENPNFFDPRISQLFLRNIDQLNSWSNPAAWFPPGVQWIHKTPILFALQNLVIFGIGTPYFVLAVFGAFTIIKHKKYTHLLFILVWIFFFFLYQSTRSSKTMRYFLLIYPFIAILAGFGFHMMTEKANNLFKALLIALVLLWPLMFFSIYTKNHSRTDATAWIYKNIKPGSMILAEYWDDALPIGGSSTYPTEMLHVFDQDTPEKWKTMNELLAKGDYYILSSNRGWGSIPTVPERYPLMTKFYADLFAGKLAYKKVAEVTSYPSLKYLGIPLSFPDDFSEEAFTVYDHPKVLIFKNTAK